MVAHKGEADDANCLKYSITEEGPACTGVTLQFFGYVGALYENGGDNDNHANQRQSGGTR